MIKNYKYIFTDGLDKILSTSIWLPDYGGNDSFVFYMNGKLKGYVSNSEINRLREVGYNQLTDEKYVLDLFNQANECVEKSKQLDLAKYPIFEQFDVARHLLNKSYSLYFNTEEFYTSKLSLEAHKETIEKIGKFRFKFMDTCIDLTEHLYSIAFKIGKEYSLTKDEILFLKPNEISSNQINKISIKERQTFFLIHQKNKNLKFYFGNNARAKYFQLMPNNNNKGSVIKGHGASVGKTTGVVYKISLTDKNVKRLIQEMPNNCILVTESTQPQMLLACQKAIGIITDEGGVLSHAAIISRELKIPCVVGCQMATELLTNNQIVEIDGDKGLVKVISHI